MGESMISALGLASLNSATAFNTNGSLAPGKTGDKRFVEVLDSKRKPSLGELLCNPRSFQELGELQNKILSSKVISPQELLLYQVKASQFGLGVELVSKIAESFSVSVRKFQNAS